MVLAIRQGLAKFDTSPMALIDLKQQGVPQSVLDAMLTPGAGGPAKTEAASQNEPPLEPGLYTGAPGGWALLSLVNPNLMRQGTRFFLQFNGPRAKVQVPTVKPVFYIRVSPDQGMGENANLSKKMWELASVDSTSLVVMPMDKTGGNRVPVFNVSGELGNTYDDLTKPLQFAEAVKKGSILKLEARQVSKTLGTLTPQVDLQPGREYAVWVQIVERSPLKFDFGVQPDAGGSSVRGSEPALVRMFRSGGQVQKPTVFVDGEELLRLPGGRRFSMELPPGLHSFKLDKVANPALTLTLESGKTYYLEGHMPFGSGHVVREVDEEKWTKENRTRTKPIEPELIKNGAKVIAE